MGSDAHPSQSFEQCCCPNGSQRIDIPYCMGSPGMGCFYHRTCYLFLGFNLQTLPEPSQVNGRSTFVQQQEKASEPPFRADSTVGNLPRNSSANTRLSPCARENCQCNGQEKTANVAVSYGHLKDLRATVTGKRTEHGTGPGKQWEPRLGPKLHPGFESIPKKQDLLLVIIKLIDPIDPKLLITFPAIKK